MYPGIRPFPVSMVSEITSSNPVVKALAEGTAPRPAQVAAARGILPLPETDLLEVLVIFANGDDAELSEYAAGSLAAQDDRILDSALRTDTIATPVLSYFAERVDVSRKAHEAVIQNPRTPLASITRLARQTANGHLLELLSVNQQLLVETPAILEAILTNPNRTPEAERRAAETKKEFFEKERGAEQIARELRAQGKEAAAEFIENADFAKDLGGSGLNIDDALFLASMIESSDADTDDSWMGLEYIEEFYEETAAIDRRSWTRSSVR